MSELDGMLAANREFQDSFSEGEKPMPPARKVAIVTCMDARIHPEQALGLEIGDAHMIRNAGGRVSDDALRSLVISSRLLGTNEFAVIHHTDCGMLTFTNADMHAKLRDECGEDTSHIDFLPFPDLEQSVRDDVATILSSPLIDDDIAVSGYIYSVRTGSVDQVVAPTTAAAAART